MTRFVLDASVALAWFLHQPVPQMAMRARRLLENGSRALVPALWHLEVANGLLLAVRRGYVSEEHSAKILTDFAQMLGGAIETNSGLVSLAEAFTTATTLHLSSYDAVYLDLARREGVSLATLDRDLRLAAEKVGVAMID